MLAKGSPAGMRTHVAAFAISFWVRFASFGGNAAKPVMFPCA